MIERCSISWKSQQCKKGDWPSLGFPEIKPCHISSQRQWTLEVSDRSYFPSVRERATCTQPGEMQAIQRHYRDGDVELARAKLGLPEASQRTQSSNVAQTWSEHCSHKIFAARIHHVDNVTGEDTTINSLFKTHIMQPTLDIQKQVDWLLSIFHDNSGVIAWNEDWSLCIKAETHNSPSALDPYGGAITGIVGVNRDIVGTGLGAEADSEHRRILLWPTRLQQLPEGLFHPSRVFRGVHSAMQGPEANLVSQQSTGP